MKAKGLFLFLGIILLGVVITSAADALVGIDLHKHYGDFAIMVHALAYTGWGAAIALGSAWKLR